MTALTTVQVNGTTYTIQGSGNVIDPETGDLLGGVWQPVRGFGRPWRAWVRAEPRGFGKTRFNTRAQAVEAVVSHGQRDTEVPDQL